MTQTIDHTTNSAGFSPCTPEAHQRAAFDTPDTTQDQEGTSTMHTATYSPDDNKLRLYPAYRLAADEYALVKEVGFKWAPKQELFVAPMWTPAREDMLIELCGEIGDEDKSLVARAEDRAERFEDYSSNREQEAEAARQAVHAIADNIPFGQPILIGHHSERRARKDAERIENGMRKAVKLWDTADYWKRRAAGAVGAALYKERPDVRARRIKGLEADKRKAERNKAEAEKFLNAYRDPEARTATLKDGRGLLSALLATFEGGLSFENRMRFERGELGLDEALKMATRAKERIIAHAARWIAHYDNRLAYERAMLGDAGGTAADQIKPEKGGACRCWASPYGGWSYIQKVNRVSVSVLDNWGNGGANFTRTIPMDKLTAMMSLADVIEAREAGRITDTEDGRGFYLAEPAGPQEQTTTESQTTATEGTQNEATTDAAAFDAMRAQLRQGVRVVSAPQLFPTPAALASRMVQIARPQIGQRVLEPSAGTGRLLEAMPGVLPSGFGALRQTCVDVVAVEKNLDLANALKASGLAQTILQADFLECSIEELGQFDVVLMNPPFENAADIKHIKHAYSMLKPGGCLVAICANGPRQAAELRGLAESTGGIWEDLPAGTFAGEGTGVNTALLVLHAPA